MSQLSTSVPVGTNRWRWPEREPPPDGDARVVLEPNGLYGATNITLWLGERAATTAPSATSIRLSLGEFASTPLKLRRSAEAR